MQSDSNLGQIYKLWKKEKAPREKEKAQEKEKIRAKFLEEKTRRHPESLEIQLLQLH